MSDGKTRFSACGMDLRISKDSAGKDKFTQDYIIEEIMDKGTAIEGANKNILCRKIDGAVLAEIENK